MISKSQVLYLVVSTVAVAQDAASFLSDYSDNITFELLADESTANLQQKADKILLESIELAWWNDNYELIPPNDGKMLQPIYDSASAFDTTQISQVSSIASF